MIGGWEGAEDDTRPGTNNESRPSLAHNEEITDENPFRHAKEVLKRLRLSPKHDGNPGAMQKSHRVNMAEEIERGMGLVELGGVEREHERKLESKAQDKESEIGNVYLTERIRCRASRPAASGGES